MKSEFAPTEKSYLLDKPAVTLGGGRSTEDDVARFEQEKRRSGLGFADFWSSVLILTKTIIGAGVIGIPKAVASAGYVLAAIIFVVFGVLSAFSCHLMHRVTVRLGVAPASFNSVCRRVMPEWVWVVDIVIVLQCVGVLISLLIIIGGTVPDAAHYVGWPGLARRTAILLGFAVAAPLTFLRHLNGLRYVAAMALSVCIWAAVMTIIYYTQGSTQFQPCASSIRPYLNHEQLPCGDAHFLPGPASWQQFGKYACTIVMAYSCQMNVFTVFNEIKEASANRADRVVTTAHFVAGVVYCIVGFFAYATYGESVTANLLMSYPRDMPMAVTRLFYTLVAVVSYPIIMNPCRVATLGLWRCIRRVLQEAKLPLPVAFTASAADEEDEKPTIESDLEFYSVTCLLLAVSLVVALTVKDLGTVYGVFGATAGVTLTFIIPSFMYMRAFNDEHNSKRHLATGLFCFGCVLAPVCFVCALIK